MLEARSYDQLGSGRPTVDYRSLGYCPPEKIFLVADMGTDLTSIALRQRGQKCDVKDRYKRLMRMFVNLKSDMNEKHEFGMFVLSHHLVLVTALGSGNSMIDEIGQTEFVEIPSVEETGGNFCDLTDVFEQIALNCSLPGFDLNQESKTPNSQIPFMVRVILFFSRTKKIPEIRLTAATKKLFDHPFFFFDALYFHPQAKEKENLVDEIQTHLQNFRKANGLFLTVSDGEVSPWHISMGRLLQSPFLRQTDLEPDFSLKTNFHQISSNSSNGKNGKKPPVVESGENLIDLE